MGKYSNLFIIVLLIAIVCILLLREKEKCEESIISVIYKEEENVWLTDLEIEEYKEMEAGNTFTKKQLEYYVSKNNSVDECVQKENPQRYWYYPNGCSSFNEKWCCIAQHWRSASRINNNK